MIFSVQWNHFLRIGKHLLNWFKEPKLIWATWRTGETVLECYQLVVTILVMLIFCRLVIFTWRMWIVWTRSCVSWDSQLMLLPNWPCWKQMVSWLQNMLRAHFNFIVVHFEHPKCLNWTCCTMPLISYPSDACASVMSLVNPGLHFLCYSIMLRLLKFYIWHCKNYCRCNDTSEMNRKHAFGLICEKKLVLLKYVL